MAKITKPLTDTEIKKAKAKDKEYKLSDGQGLYLVVKVNNSKFFRFDFTYNGKRKSMSFGVYPETSLKEARDKREKAREQLNNNINPVESKKTNFEDIATFKYIATKWFNLMKSEWKPVTYELNENRLNLHVYPYIGDKDISILTRLDILKIIQKLQEKEHFEIAERILNVIERIFKYSVTYGYIEHNIIADIDKKTIFAKKIVTHRATLTKEDEIVVLSTSNLTIIWRTIFF